MNRMIYQVEDTPKKRDIFVGVIQRMLASVTATILVPIFVATK